MKLSSSPSSRLSKPSFAESVRAWVQKIPPGRVASYGDIAALAGSPRAARGVGAVLNGLAPGSDVPWWRVVNRSGRLTIPAELGLRTLQRTLLEREGVSFRPNGEIELERHHWAGPAGRRELDVDGVAS
ncbi:MAG: MGMT family protein [Gemmatimonadetes bacterium]|nr:MGMT family protein [Gemmatimonadota bacterium]